MSGGQQGDAGHGHDHGLPGAGHRRPLAVVLGISGTILAVEVAGAFISGSLALVADAWHMLTDVAGLSFEVRADRSPSTPAAPARHGEPHRIAPLPPDGRPPRHAFMIT